MQGQSLKTWRLFFVVYFWLQIFKALSAVKPLATHWVKGKEISETTHDKEYRLYKINFKSPQINNYNKEQHENLEREENLISIVPQLQ